MAELRRFDESVTYLPGHESTGSEQKGPSLKTDPSLVTEFRSMPLRSDPDTKCKSLEKLQQIRQTLDSIEQSLPRPQNTSTKELEPAAQLSQQTLDLLQKSSSFISKDPADGQRLADLRSAIDHAQKL